MRALAGVLGFTAVALGAFGAHGLKEWFAANPALLPTWQTAVQYHLFMAIAVFAISLSPETFALRTLRIAGWLFAAGVVLFSGSLYLLAVAAVPRWFGAITPIGGIAFLLGWCLVALSRKRVSP